ncbi:hypothetical protein MMC18_000211 [Xylographa bjoerkii]|nr:hypothetical protein [Xylographa bjoerkii]
MAPQLAWIGLGNMGRGMCKNLVEKGDLDKPLIIFNRTTKRATDLQAKLSTGKSTVVEELGEAVAKADIIFTCLGDDQAITETLSTAVRGDVKGKLFVDCSTVHPDTTNKLVKTVEEHGAHFVACPVFGAPAMAEGGQLVCVLAGQKSLVEKVRPYCKGVIWTYSQGLPIDYKPNTHREMLIPRSSTSGRAEIDFSDQAPGKATHLKIIGNTFVLNMVETLSEGHALAEKSGLGSENLHNFIETMFPGPYTAYSGRLMGGDYYKRDEPLFGVDLARKDAKHALSLANACGVKMRDLEVADAHLADVQKVQGSKGDIAGIYGAVRQESGLKYEN